MKKKIMKMYGKGLTKDEQTAKKKTDEDLFNIMLKEYNNEDKYNKMLAKTTIAIPKALMPDQFEPLPDGEWEMLRKTMKRIAKDVERERQRIEDVSGKNDSDTDHTPDEETTMDESSKKNKKSQAKSAYLEYWIKVLEDEPDLFTKISCSLDKSVFSESGSSSSWAKKIGTAKKSAKRKADDELVVAFKQDTEVNKQRLALDNKRLAMDNKRLTLEYKKNDTIQLAVQNDIVSRLRSDRNNQQVTVKALKKELTEHISDRKERKLRIERFAANEEGASQDSAATLLEDYIREQNHLDDMEKELAEEQNKKKKMGEEIIDRDNDNNNKTDSSGNTGNNSNDDGAIVID